MVQIIKDVGFPIAVALFVLIRLNGQLTKLTNEIVRLSERIEELSDHMLTALTSKSYKE